MAATSFPTSPARPFVYADLEALPEDGYRREIIGGTLVVNPAPLGRHQQASGALFSLLRAAAPSRLLVIAAPYDWRLGDGGSVQPDLMVVDRSDFDPDGPFPASAIPTLVVEILSPSNAEQDRTLKRAVYQRQGVPAYWMVDPGSATQPPSLIALRLGAGQFVIEAEVTGSDRFATDWPFPLHLVPTDLTI
ncbi:MAG: Uma2 family endonuclease [Actinomycetota bacterium]|nr:Uma2 family endonuclease [Actinomycetota bacterium]